MDETEDGHPGASAGDPAALHIALDAARADQAMREDARAVLCEHARLSRIQADQLSEDSAFMRRSLRMTHPNEMMKFAFALEVSLVLAAIVAALATAMW